MRSFRAGFVLLSQHCPRLRSITLESRPPCLIPTATLQIECTSRPRPGCLSAKVHRRPLPLFPWRRLGPRHPLHPLAGVVGVFVCGLVAFLTLYATQPLLPLLETLFHASKSAVGWTVSASTLGVAISAPLLGTFTERMNRKRVILVSILAACGAHLCRGHFHLARLADLLASAAGAHHARRLRHHHRLHHGELAVHRGRSCHEHLRQRHRTRGLLRPRRHRHHGRPCRLACRRSCPARRDFPCRRRIRRDGCCRTGRARTCSKSTPAIPPDLHADASSPAESTPAHDVSRWLQRAVFSGRRLHLHHVLSRGAALLALHRQTQSAVCRVSGRAGRNTACRRAAARASASVRASRDPSCSRWPACCSHWCTRCRCRGRASRFAAPAYSSRRAAPPVFSAKPRRRPRAPPP